MEHEDKNIEALINKLIAADTLEQPTLDFTDKVMEKVAETSTNATVYKPLISKYMWWSIAASFLALVGYVLFQKPSDNISIAERYSLPEVSLNPLEGLSFDFSSTLMYAIVLLAIMVSIQVTILKHYFNNKMSF